MMQFVATVSDGTEVDLGLPARFVHTASAYTAQSGMTALFRLPAQEKVLTGIRGLLDGVLFFRGDVTRQTRLLGGMGKFLELECSGFAARMLQDQVQPKVLVNYSSNQLFADYAAPYGVTGNDLSPAATVARLEVSPGMTAWNVIDVFCRQAYEYVPRLTRDGRLTTLLMFNESHSISNDPTQQAHRYYDIKVHDKRGELVSKVHYKEDASDSYDYSGVVNNSFTSRYGVRRERYYRPPKAWRPQADLAAFEVIRNSNLRSLEVELAIPELVWMHPGDYIEFKDDFFFRKNYYVGESTMIADAGGYRTRVKLWDSIRG